MSNGRRPLAERFEDMLSRVSAATGFPVNQTSEHQWEGHCPCHSDNRASLCLSDRGVGRGNIVLFCQAGCDTKLIVERIGLQMSDLFPPRDGGSGSRIECTYPYHDESGTLLFEVVRFLPKKFLQRRPDGGESWVWNTKGVRKVLFRLPEIIAADSGERILIAEGEKDVLNLVSAGFVATTNPGGAQRQGSGAAGSRSKWRDEYSEQLRGRAVAILPDADLAGTEHAASVAKSLYGKAKSIKIVALPGLSEKQDASDWLAAGGNREQLLKLIEMAPEFVPNANAAPAACPAEEFCITNFEEVFENGPDGTETKRLVPRPMADIVDDITRATGGWPRVAGGVMFVDDPSHGLDWFDRRTTAGLFGWLRRQFQVKWTSGGNFVSQNELFAELERTAERFDAIESLPHEPRVSGVYYRSESPQPGDGMHLNWLLDRFRPETTIDRDLIRAAILTAFWGGPPGSRPAFVITSDDGRGAGKSVLAEMIGRLCGGFLDVSAGEEIGVIKTRLLSAGARTKRIAMLDNVKTMRLSWAELESLITSATVSGRQFYAGEGERPNLLTWFITLNGVSLATDMAQRSVIIKIVRGENDGPWREDTAAFIDANRDKIIADVISALRAPQLPLDKFTRWATWEKGVLSRLPSPTEAQALILERQQVADCELDEAGIVQEYFEDRLYSLGYNADTAMVRIKVAIAAEWLSLAVGERIKTVAASKRLRQMITEGQLHNLSEDKSRTHGRCFIFSGTHCDYLNDFISNDLESRIAERARGNAA